MKRQMKLVVWCAESNIKCWNRKSQKPIIYSRRFKKDSYIKIGTLLAITFAGYDAINNQYAFCEATSRFARSLKTAAGICFDYVLLELKEGGENYEKLLKEVHQKSASRLLQTCLLNGGLYIKIGQGFASMNHILPKEYTSTLAKLHNECLPTSIKDIQSVFLEDFGVLPEDIFDDFDYKPIAAASLAQVFCAKLKSGEKVAVKVQYHDLKKRFPTDIRTLMTLQNIIEIFFKNYNFGWILQDLTKNLIEEMDFIKEASNSERCANDLKHLDFVYVPAVVWDKTKERVLTLEWIDGIKVSDMECIANQKISLKEIDEKLFTMFSHQIFISGFVHADPHPGNVFVRKAKNEKKIELVLLDHGLYEEVPDSVRKPLSAFWVASVLKDEKKMQKAAAELNITDYMNFAEVLFQVPMDFKSGPLKTKLTEKDVAHMQEIASKRFDKIMKTLREMPRNLIFVVRNLNTIRAIGRQHGDIVNRPLIMARHAQRCISENERSIISKFQSFIQRIKFEFNIWRNDFKISCISFYVNLLHKLGRAPESAKNFLKTIEPETNNLY